MKLGSNIKTIRERWGMSQEQFGKLLGGFSMQQIGKYEKNKNELRLITLIQLVEMTGISFYSLCMSDLDDSMIPEQPIEAIKMDLFSEADTPHQKLKKLSASHEDLTKKLLEVYEENRQLGIENRALREVINEMSKLKMK